MNRSVRQQPRFGRSAARIRAVVLCLLGTLGCAQPPRDAESQFIGTVRAAAWIENGKLERGRELLEEVAKAAETSHAWTNVGVARLASADAGGAEKAWHRALEIEPTDARASFLLARLNFDRVEKATNAATDAARRTELLDTARQHALTAVAGAAHDAATHALLASIERLRGDSTAAAAAALQAARIDPGRSGNGVDRMGGIQAPQVRRAAGLTRAAPVFAELRLEATATGVRAADPNEDGRVDLLLEGSREWIEHVQTMEAENVRWRAKLLAPEPVLGVRAVAIGDERRQDVLWWARGADAAGANVQVSWAFGGQDSLRPHVLAASSPAWNDVAPLDVDADGDLDLVVATSATPGMRLWRKQRAAVFDADSTVQAFAGSGAIHCIEAADLDADGLGDLVAVDASQRIRIWGGRARETFIGLDAAAGLDAAGVHDIAIADVDADGDLDLLAASVDGLWVFTNHGTGSFQRHAVYRPTHIGWSARSARGIGITRIHVVDIDNDGYNDVVTQHVPVPQIASARREREDAAPRLPAAVAVEPESYLGLWHNDSQGGLRDVSEEAGFDEVAAAGSAVASADLDEDGDTDLVYVGADGFVRVLWNRCSETSRRLHVELVRQGRDAFPVGARITVYAGAMTRHMLTQGQHASIGIGALSHADVVRVVWPDGTAQSAIDVALPENPRIRFER